MRKPLLATGARWSRAGAGATMVAALLVAVVLCWSMAGRGALAFADEGDDAAAAGETSSAVGASEGETPAGAAALNGVRDASDDTSAAVGAPPGVGTTTVDGAQENRVDPTQRADNSFIYDTSIGAISEQSNLYDNRTVQVEGEVIGDLINAQPGYYWIQLSSRDDNDAATISVFISKDQTAQIDRFGRYGVTGTTLQVRGIYHQACDEHEGLSDIHAANSAVVAVGIDHPDEIHLEDFLPGLVTVAIGVILLFVFRFARERLR